MAVSAPLINGRHYSYSSIEAAIIFADGSRETFIDITELSYSDALNISFVQGTNRAPIGWTAGMYEPGDSSMTVTKSSFQTGIVEKIGAGWLGANITIVAKYADEGMPLTTDELTSRIAGAEDSHSFGPDNLNVKVALKTILIKRNGITPLLNHLQ